MVSEDYGKRAYVKLNALEKRIEKLENFAMESVYSEIFYNLSGAELGSEFDKAFKVDVLKDGLYTITANLATDLASLFTVKCDVYINGVKACGIKNVILSSHSFSFDAPLYKGINEINVKVYSSSIFTLTTLNFKLCGNVAYVKMVNSLSHFASDNKDYVLHLNDDKCIIYFYSDGLFYSVGKYEDVKECSILGIKNNALIILMVGLDGGLQVLSFDITQKTFATYNLKVSGVNSACGFYKSGKFVIYFSKLSMIYKGNYTLGSNFYYSETNLKGVKLYADPIADGNMVVVDKYLNAKLFTD